MQPGYRYNTDLSTASGTPSFNVEAIHCPPFSFEACNCTVRVRNNLIKSVAVHATAIGASLHMPRIGCGLAGGSWDVIQPILESIAEPYGLDLYVYDL